MKCVYTRLLGFSIEPGHNAQPNGTRQVARSARNGTERYSSRNTNSRETRSQKRCCRMLPQQVFEKKVLVSFCNL